MKGVLSAVRGGTSPAIRRNLRQWDKISLGRNSNCQGSFESGKYAFTGVVYLGNYADDSPDASGLNLSGRGGQSGHH
ncbi:hypothetical protein [Paenibacillus sp. 22594]|uniref:hypothetical protein n=1 Tax=Paenibacillus sp. 22594 TaxID=3453947 RepID=UPI003F86BF9B